jgi:2,3-bisphosphoglycerate-independent phosphoglycerate mutase
MVAKLPAHLTLVAPQGPVVLCILDGVGLGLGGPDDAVTTAPTPHLDRLRATCPTASLVAHGPAVGLPSVHDMGNSEVGHNAMGAGRVFEQGAKLVQDAIASGEAWQTEVWQKLVSSGTLHLIGLVSDGNVHSHIDHLRAMIDRAVLDGVIRLRVHVLTDGRDVPARSALSYIQPLEEKLAQCSTGACDYAIASGGGRMRITMDRYEADWAMVERGYRAHVLGEGRHFASASEAIETLYGEDPETHDQWLEPFVCVRDGQPVGRILDGDTVLFFNFRGDRAIEISSALEGDRFDRFDRGDAPDIFFAGMMQYDGDLRLPRNFLVPPPTIDRTMGEYLVASGLRSFVVSETQKYGHVTYFFNGNRSGYLDDQLETYVEIPSDNIPFDQRPWMKAAEITDAAIKAIESGEYDHVRLNLANGDMVGHTGNLEATRIAMTAVDHCVARLEHAVRAAQGVLIVTADHGNAEEMWMRTQGGEVLQSEDGAPVARMSHTLHPVPAILIDPTGERTLGAAEDAGIAQIGATVLALLGLETPEGYLPSLAIPTPSWRDA